MKKFIVILFVLTFTKALASDDNIVLKCIIPYYPDAIVEIKFDQKSIYFDGYHYDLIEDKVYLFGKRGSDEKITINRYDLTGVWNQRDQSNEMYCTQLKKKI